MLYIFSKGFIFRLGTRPCIPSSCSTYALSDATVRHRRGKGRAGRFDHKNSAAAVAAGSVIASSCLWRFALFGIFDGDGPSVRSAIPAHICWAVPALDPQSDCLDMQTLVASAASHFVSHPHLAWPFVNSIAFQSS